MIHHIVRRPVGAIVIALAIAVLGMLAWQTLRVTLLPSVESPIITVRADREGSSALELEEQVLDAPARRVGDPAGLVCDAGPRRPGSGRSSIGPASGCGHRQ